MYKHILLPTDGSSLSLVAIDSDLKFAKAIEARVTGFYVIVERLIGIPCEVYSTQHASPHVAIITFATQAECDLVVRPPTK